MVRDDSNGRDREENTDIRMNPLHEEDNNEEPSEFIKKLVDTNSNNPNDESGRSSSVPFAAMLSQIPADQRDATIARAKEVGGVIIEDPNSDTDMIPDFEETLPLGRVGDQNTDLEQTGVDQAIRQHTPPPKSFDTYDRMSGVIDRRNEAEDTFAALANEMDKEQSGAFILPTAESDVQYTANQHSFDDNTPTLEEEEELSQALTKLIQEEVDKRKKTITKIPADDVPETQAPMNKPSTTQRGLGVKDPVSKAIPPAIPEDAKKVKKIPKTPIVNKDPDPSNQYADFFLTAAEQEIRKENGKPPKPETHIPKVIEREVKSVHPEASDNATTAQYSEESRTKPIDYFGGQKPIKDVDTLKGPISVNPDKIGDDTLEDPTLEQIVRDSVDRISVTSTENLYEKPKKGLFSKVKGYFNERKAKKMKAKLSQQADNHDPKAYNKNNSAMKRTIAGISVAAVMLGAGTVYMSKLICAEQAEDSQPVVVMTQDADTAETSNYDASQQGPVMNLGNGVARDSQEAYINLEDIAISPEPEVEQEVEQVQVVPEPEVVSQPNVETDPETLSGAQNTYNHLVTLARDCSFRPNNPDYRGTAEIVTNQEMINAAYKQAYNSGIGYGADHAFAAYDFADHFLLRSIGLGIADLTGEATHSNRRGEAFTMESILPGADTPELHVSRVRTPSAQAAPDNTPQGAPDITPENNQYTSTNSVDNNQTDSPHPDSNVPATASTLIPSTAEILMGDNSITSSFMASIEDSSDEVADSLREIMDYATRSVNERPEGSTKTTDRPRRLNSSDKGPKVDKIEEAWHDAYDAGILITFNQPVHESALDLMVNNHTRSSSKSFTEQNSNLAYFMKDAGYSDNEITVVFAEKGISLDETQLASMLTLGNLQAISDNEFEINVAPIQDERSELDRLEDVQNEEYNQSIFATFNQPNNDSVLAPTTNNYQRSSSKSFTEQDSNLAYFMKDAGYDDSEVKYALAEKGILVNDNQLTKMIALGNIQATDDNEFDIDVEEPSEKYTLDSLNENRIIPIKEALANYKPQDVIEDQAA